MTFDLCRLERLEGLERLESLEKTIYDYLWQFMTIYKNWMTIEWLSNDYLWLLMTIYDNVWPFYSE